MDQDPRSTRASLLAALKDPKKWEEAWREFVNHYRPVILEICLRMGLQQDQGENMAQEVFLVLLKEMPTYVYDPNQSFGAWLWAVVRNKVRDYWREKKRHWADQGTGDSAVQQRLAELPDDRLADELSARMNGDFEFMQKVMDRVRASVPEKKWQAYWMFTQEGLPVQEIAKRLGITTGSVYVYDGLVKKLLQKAIDEENSNPS